MSRSEVTASTSTRVGSLGRSFFLLQPSTLLTGRTACRQPTCERLHGTCLPSPLASYLRAEQSSGDAASGAVRDRAVAVQERRRRPRRAARVLRSDNGCCVWTGVMCGEAKAAVAIVGLALPNRTLRGQVVVSLPSLAALRVLNLSGNAIRGALPARSTSSLRSRSGSATASSSLPCCCPLRPQHRQG